MMFSEQHMSRLIELGWAPTFSDDFRINGFDKVVMNGETVVYPTGCGKLYRNRMVWYDANGVVVSRLYEIKPFPEAICA